jgi:hypothetical protein
VQITAVNEGMAYPTIPLLIMLDSIGIEKQSTLQVLILFSKKGQPHGYYENDESQ